MSPEIALPSENASSFGKASAPDSDSRWGTDLGSENSLSSVTALRSGNACSSENALSSRIASGRPAHTEYPRGNLDLFRQTFFPLLIYYNSIRSSAGEWSISPGSCLLGAFAHRVIDSFTTDSPPLQA